MHHTMNTGDVSGAYTGVTDTMTNDREFEIITRTQPTAYFLGVTTTHSFSRKLFPHWMMRLGLPEAQLIGVDLAIDSPPERYRQAIYQIKHDPLSLGAVITTHKINTLNAARDLFNHLSPEATLTQEVSSVYKRDGNLIGHTVDPITSGLSMRQFIPSGYWSHTGAHILCLGAGGAAAAISVHLARTLPADERPARVIFVDIAAYRLESLRQLIEKYMPDSRISFEFVENRDPALNDQMMRALPPGSLVINATGMGKDIPGSPITDAGIFPQDGIVWELNYRGQLDFLYQAERQATQRSLTVGDGWYYFLVGWITIIGQIFDIAITPEIFTELRQLATQLR